MATRPNRFEITREEAGILLDSLPALLEARQDNEFNVQILGSLQAALTTFFTEESA